MIRNVTWLSVLMPLLIGCTRSTPPVANLVKPGADVAQPMPKPSAVASNVQGITPAEIQDFYHLPEGSELYPLAWIKALNDLNTRQPFLNNIERFGMLPDPDDPDGLPIGVSRGESKGLKFLGPMIGVNCAACHVAQLTYQGKSLTLIGGPSMISMDRFYGDLFASAGAMVKNPAELAAFYERLAKSGGAMPEQTRLLLAMVGKLARKPTPMLEPAEKAVTDKFTALLGKVHKDLHANIDTVHASGANAQDQLRKQLTARYELPINELLTSATDADLKDAAPDRDQLRAGIEQLVTNVALMKGRLNFLLKIKELHGGAATTPGPGRSDAFGVISNMVMPGEKIKLTAPVSYPPIWSLGPPYETVWFHYDGNTNSLLQRNVGQAIGLGAAFDEQTFSSTIIIRDMDRLQKITRKLRPPPWPAELLGPIDQAAADRGRKLFGEHCLKCHADVYEENHASRERYIDYEKVGTDPARIENYQINVLKTAQNPGGTPYIKALADAAERLTSAAYKDWNVTPKEQQEIEPEKVVWVSKKAYMARPLVAIWASAPYLHNGSVPTLHHLLQPAAKRPRFFTVGNRAYDPKKLGYVFKEVANPNDPVDSPQWVFDTTLEGNKNTGHEYGVLLDDHQKDDLLEYLKGNYAAKAP